MILNRLTVKLKRMVGHPPDLGSLRTVPRRTLRQTGAIAPMDRKLFVTINPQDQPAPRCPTQRDRPGNDPLLAR
jgi:hypothetical protein